MSIWAEVAAEADRAHAKHGATSMRATDPLDPMRLPILLEEVGEIARWFNELRHDGVTHPGVARLAQLRDELVQVSAMAGDWADAIRFQVGQA